MLHYSIFNFLRFKSWVSLAYLVRPTIHRLGFKKGVKLNLEENRHTLGRTRKLIRDEVEGLSILLLRMLKRKITDGLSSCDGQGFI